MKSSQAIANWLFERVGLDVALSGDLLEERERRRSAIWYSRQVLIAAILKYPSKTGVHCRFLLTTV